MRDTNEARPAMADAAHAISIRRILLSAAAILAAALPTWGAGRTKAALAPSPVGNYEILKNFIYAAGRPRAALLEVSAGVFCGTASESDQGKGSIFQISPDGSTGFFTTSLHTFTGPDGELPMSPLIDIGDPYLYGTTTHGGDTGYGTIYRMPHDGTDFETLYTFGGSEDGRYPFGGLLAGGDWLYGTTTEGGGGFGVVFRISPGGTDFTVLHAFSGTDGAYPDASLIWGTDGNLYGTTGGGGASDAGTIFSLSSDGTVFGTVYDFGGSGYSLPTGPVFQGASGKLYGTANFSPSGYGIVYAVGTDGSDFQVLYDFTGDPDGESPRGGVIQADDGKFYGVTVDGGASDFGTVFRLTLTESGADVAILHEFDETHGSYPAAPLIQGSDGALYGTTDGGGAGSNGTVYRLSLDGTSFTLLSELRTAIEPAAAVIRGSDGRLYGTTFGGDWLSRGAVFRMTTDGGLYRILHTFDGTDGSDVPAALIEGDGGWFYGITRSGGAGDCGTVFRISAEGTGFALLHEFGGIDGCRPATALVAGPAGSFFGTTSMGSESGAGTVFKISPAGESWTLETLHAFDGTDGSDPNGVILGSDGRLYGTTAMGGASSFGTIFSMTTSGGDFTTLLNFDDTLGFEPRGPLVEGAAGTFYGTTRGDSGYANYGTIFKISSDGTGFATLHAFNGNDGWMPIAGVIRDAGGRFFGTTDSGGIYGNGTVFRLDADETTFTTLRDFEGSPDGANPEAELLLTDGKLYGTTRGGGWSGDGTVFAMEILTAGPSVSASAGGPTTFCQGGNVVLTATPSGGSGSYTGYQWYEGGAAIDGETASTFTATEGGSYTVTVTDSASSTSDPSAPVAVTVNSVPEATIIAEGATTFCAGGSVTLTASTGSSWLWSTAETTQSITVTSAGDYTVTVTDANGCSATSEATTVVIPPAPTAMVSGSAAICARGSATIQAVLTGTAPWGLNWSDGYIQTNITTSPVTRVVSPRAATTYTVTRVWDDYCDAGTSDGSAEITIASAPKAVLKGSATICPGGSTELTVELTGTGPWDLTWSDGEVSSLVASSPFVRTVSPGVSTIYSITSVSDTGCGTGTARGSARVKVAAPDATITTRSTVCASSTRNTASVSTAGKGATYAWTIERGAITSTDTTRSIQFTPDGSGDVVLHVTVTTADGCSSTGDMTVTLNTGC